MKLQYLGSFLISLLWSLDPVSCLVVKLSCDHPYPSFWVLGLQTIRLHSIIKVISLVNLLISIRKLA